MKLHVAFVVSVFGCALAACSSGATVGSGGAVPAGGRTATPTSTPSGGSSGIATATPSPSPAASATPTGSTSAVADGTIPGFSLPLTHSGRWLTDADGRVVTYHGINVAYKVPPYTPEAQGFTKADADMLAREGFSNVRLWVFWQELEPQPGVWDDTYLAQVKQFVDWLYADGVTTRLNFAQIIYSKTFGGLGLPDWSTETDGLPVINMGGIAEDGAELSYKRAFDHFWMNDPYPDAMGLQDHCARAWEHVATYFKSDPGVMAYDIINEPNSGEEEPLFEEVQLTQFYEKIIAGIRTVDPVRQIDYEPELSKALTPTGTQVAAGSDPNLSLNFHYYPADNETDAGIAQITPAAMELMESAAQTNDNDAVEMSEFGATDDLTILADIINAADSERLGWLYWAFYSTEPTGDPANNDGTVDHPEEGIVYDPTKPPVESNLKTAKLLTLERPYPFLIAGTPTVWSFDATTTTFTLSYATTSVSGKPLTNSTSEIVVPARVYPNGYTAAATGAAIVSAPNATTLVLVPATGATTITLTISPATGTSAKTRARRTHG